MIKQMLLYGVLIACLIAPVHAQAQEPQTETKIVIIHYTISGDVLRVINSRIIYGYPPNNLGHDELTVKILSSDNASLRQLGVDDPRILYYDGGAKVLESVNFSIIVPFYPSMGSVDVYNGTSGALMSHAEMTGTVSAFCNDHRGDKDCAGVSGSFPPWGVIAGIVGILAVAGAAGFMYFRRQQRGDLPDKK